MSLRIFRWPRHTRPRATAPSTRKERFARSGVAFCEALLFVALVLQPPQISQASTRAALGTSAAIDADGHLWIALAEPEDGKARIVLQRSEDDGASWSAPIRVQQVPEPVAADGENRPKLAFGKKGEIYVTWTSPTSAQYTGDIRFARSVDRGRTWSTPVVVHRDRQLISHRFETLQVDRDGRVWVAWLDKRDAERARAEGDHYAGAAIYYAHSDDRGASWDGDFKLADNTCECCRIALATDDAGRLAAFWRHVFPPNERDHAFAYLASDATTKTDIQRATFDRWAIDACPHHGPSLAVAPNGARHAVWFNQVGGAGRAFYGQLSKSGPVHVRQLPAGATHADVAVHGNTVVAVWKRFDGSKTRVESWVSKDAGLTFAPGASLDTQQDSDQPRLVAGAKGIVLVWRRADGVSVQKLSQAATSVTSTRSPIASLDAESSGVVPFTRGTLAQIEREHAGKPFWLLLWDLECGYCMKSLSNLAQAQRARPDLKVVTIATDSIDSADQIRARLQELGVESQAYAFAGGPPEALRFAIDQGWLGEKPRAYRYDESGQRKAVSGVIGTDGFQ